VPAVDPRVQLKGHRLVDIVAGRAVLLLGNGPSCARVQARDLEAARRNGFLVAGCNYAGDDARAEVVFAVDDEPAAALIKAPARPDRHVALRALRVPPDRPDVVAMPDAAVGTSTGHGAAWSLAAAGARAVVLVGFDGPLDPGSLTGQSASGRVHRGWVEWLLRMARREPALPTRWFIVGDWSTRHPLEDLPAARAATVRDACERALLTG
jgi:hypothetical protein